MVMGRRGGVWRVKLAKHSRKSSLSCKTPKSHKKKTSIELVFQSEASAGFEPAIKVLQTSALPLGDDAK